MRLPLLALALGLGLAACDFSSLPDASTADVLTFGCAKEADGCPLGGIADGTTPVPLMMCVPATVTDRSTTLTATLQLSPGNAWTNPTASAAPGALTVPLSGERCIDLAFIPSTTVGDASVYATVGNVVVTQKVPLHPAPIGAVEVTAQEGASTPDMLGSLMVTVLAKGNGLPSIGTTVTTAVTGPSAAMVVVSPSALILDANPAGTSPLTVSTATVSFVPTGIPDGGSLSALTVTVTATPPEDPDGTAGVPVSQTIAIP